MNNKYLIKKFFRNELTKEEAKLFSQKKEDPLFLEELENEIIAIQSRKQLKQKLQGVGKDINNSKKARKKFFPLSIAASVILLIGAFFFFSHSPNNQELFNEYYNTYPNIYTQKGSENENKTIFEKTMILYDAKQYSLAKQNFEVIAAKNTLSDAESFYYGATLLELKNTKQAIQQFNGIANDSPLYKDAQWYLALSYIQVNNIDLAKTTLQNLQNKVSIKKQEKIISLLNQL
ncbi:tetratricopeptide repeat protein [Pseudofulvibacter geojedonensis]|uniref:Tol-pal system YbgF family protein n=1 Tax=Pseudofulvibacter geojedonensis TaxID=1123758 RepID=A0ABW3I5B0_9FLAO